MELPTEIIAYICEFSNGKEKRNFAVCNKYIYESLNKFHKRLFYEVKNTANLRGNMFSTPDDMRINSKLSKYILKVGNVRNIELSDYVKKMPEWVSKKTVRDLECYDVELNDVYENLTNLNVLGSYVDTKYFPKLESLIIENGFNGLVLEKDLKYLAINNHDLKGFTYESKKYKLFKYSVDPPWAGRGDTCYRIHKTRNTYKNALIDNKYKVDELVIEFTECVYEFEYGRCSDSDSESDSDC